MRSETKSVSEANSKYSGKCIVMEETNSVSGNNPPLHSDPLLGPAGVESC